MNPEIIKNYFFFGVEILQKFINSLFFSVLETLN